MGAQLLRRSVARLGGSRVAPVPPTRRREGRAPHATTGTREKLRRVSGEETAATCVFTRECGQFRNRPTGVRRRLGVDQRACRHVANSRSVCRTPTQISKAKVRAGESLAARDRGERSGVSIAFCEITRERSPQRSRHRFRAVSTAAHDASGRILFANNPRTAYSRRYCR